MAGGWTAPAVPALSAACTARRSLGQRLACAVLLIGPAASAISLSNFQLITSSTIPLSCILAYNEPLAGCSVGDFTSGRPIAGCSSSCRAGIRSTQLTLRATCVGVLAPPGSVLGEVLLGNGNLVPFLCGNSAVSSAGTKSIERQVPTVAVVLPSTPTFIPTPSSTAETTLLPDDGDGPADETSTEFLTIPTETVLPTFSETAARQTRAPPPPNRPDDRGGGSPFDNRAPAQRPLRNMRISILCVAVNAFLFWR